MTDEVTTFYEGGTVSYTGTAMPPAQGRLMTVTASSAYVEWKSGSRAGEVELVSLYDIAPVLSPASIAKINPTSHTAVKQVHDAEGAPGVMVFLATTHKLARWNDVAREVLALVEDRIRRDAVMDIVYEQLDHDDAEGVVRHASRVLLRDAFAYIEED